MTETSLPTLPRPVSASLPSPLPAPAEFCRRRAAWLRIAASARDLAGWPPANHHLPAHLADRSLQLPLHLLHAQRGNRACPQADILGLPELEEIVSALIRVGVRRVRLTGGEPTVRKRLGRSGGALGRFGS